MTITTYNPSLYTNYNTLPFPLVQTTCPVSNLQDTLQNIFHSLTQKNVNSSLITQSKITTLPISPKFTPLLSASTRASSHTTVESNHFHLPLFTTINHQQLSEKFENLGIIGSGGEAKVFKVRCKQTDKLYAMRIENEMQSFNTPHRKDFFNQMLIAQKNNPHLTKTYTAFWLEFKNYPFSGGKKQGILPYGIPEKGQFVRTDFMNDPEANTYYREIIVMELGEGDGEDKIFRNSDTASLDIDFQMYFNNFCLDEYGILPKDEKARNYIWKYAKDEYVHGKCMADYAYWHYKIGQYDLYLPRQNFVVKRTDFGNWQLSTNPINSTDRLAQLAAHHNLTIEKILQIYRKPTHVSGSEILNIH